GASAPEATGGGTRCGGGGGTGRRPADAIFKGDACRGVRSRVPVHVSDQPVHRGPAHLRIRLYHGTEAWGQVRPQSDAIKACDTEIVWNPKAAFVSGAHCAHCKKVVRAHQGGRAIAPAQGVCDFADRGFHEGHLDEREGVEPEAFHGQAEPRKTLLCAVRCTEAATDHGDALVTHV